MDPVVELEHLRSAIADVRAVLGEGDLDAAVPSCPGWDLGDLGRHLGELHQWVRAAIVEGRPDLEPTAPPADLDGFLAWYDEGSATLLDLLAGTDPATPCWAFGPKPTVARFWFRRQAHEHAVHAWDAFAARGRVRPIDPELALDGVDEVARLFFPRQVRLHRIPPLTRSLAVRADGADRAWVLAGDGMSAVPPADAEASVAGPAEALYLLLWHRTGLDDPRLAVTGDRTAAEAVLGTAVVP